MALNRTKIKLTYPDGTEKFKPWSSKFYKDRLHLRDAKRAYMDLMLDEGVVITLVK